MQKKHATKHKKSAKKAAFARKHPRHKSGPKKGQFKTKR